MAAGGAVCACDLRHDWVHNGVGEGDLLRVHVPVQHQLLHHLWAVHGVRHTQPTDRTGEHTLC